jgi:hypothetical protein
MNVFYINRIKYEKHSSNNSSSSRSRCDTISYVIVQNVSFIIGKKSQNKTSSKD